jgi:hypothetical protein
MLSLLMVVSARLQGCPLIAACHLMPAAQPSFRTNMRHPTCSCPPTPAHALPRFPIGSALVTCNATLGDVTTQVRGWCRYWSLVRGARSIGANSTSY